MAARILVVDDEPDIVMLLKKALDKRGYEVLTAVDGPTALTLARSSRPDLMILDIMMPDLDGLSVCQVLKDDISTRRIKIVFLTARDQTSDRALGEAAGADAYMTKPFETEDLVTTIRKLLA